MHKIIFSCFFIGLFNPTIAQDSLYTNLLIPLEDLRFSSTFEEGIFTKLDANESVDYLSFLIASSKQDSLFYIDTRKKIDAFSELQKASTQKAPKKVIKVLTKEVRETYFDKYQYENEFANIFIDKQYNCVSGSALYALIFDNLEIPYEIHEFPTHVLLVSYPNTEDIEVESTDAMSGYIQFTPKMKQEYADYLRESRIISEAEYAEGAEVVFQKNYYDSKIITKRQLAGIQYYNLALYEIDKNDFEAAAVFASKAYYLYPSEHVSKALIVSAATEIEASDFNEDYTYYLKLLVNLKGAPALDNAYFIGVLAHIGESNLYSSGDTSLFGRAYREIANTEDSSLYADATFIYSYEMARFFALSNEIEAMLPYSLKAISIDSNNLKARKIAVACLLGNWAKMDVKDTYLSMDETLLKYPFLKKDKLIINARANILLWSMGYYYTLGEPKEGEKFKKQFEAFVDIHGFKNCNIISENFINSYKEAVAYHYRRSQFKTADQIMDKALSYDPDNLEFLRMKKRYK